MTECAADASAAPLCGSQDRHAAALICVVGPQALETAPLAMFRSLVALSALAAVSGYSVASGPRAPVARRSALAAKPAGVAMAAADDFVPDMERRVIMNALLVGATAVPGLWLAGGYAYFFLPPGGAGSGGGQVARDALGDEVTVEKWLATHAAGERKLVEGLKGDATYLIVTPEKKIESYALNAVCTHLGCVVPWNSNAQKFICPCHGSQYDSTGKVVRGPAPLSLALAHVNQDSGKVVLSTWTEEDFRTGLQPWWK